jgi:hypothetical protein
MRNGINAWGVVGDVDELHGVIYCVSVNTNDDKPRLVDSTIADPSHTNLRVYRFLHGTLSDNADGLDFNVTNLQAAGIVNPTFVKAATTMLSAQVKLGDDGTAYVDTAMGPKVLSDYVRTWASSEGKDFVAPPSGGGAGGSKGGGGALPKGNLGGSQADRLAAIKSKFPDLAG